MSKASKTARASMVTGPTTKTVISDETYVKNLRDDLSGGRYVAQEGARALLRAYDTALVVIGELNEHVANLEADKTNSENLIKDLIAAKDKLQIEFDTTVKNAVNQVVVTAEVDLQLQAAKTRITELEGEIAAAQEIFGKAAKFTEYTSLEALEAEAKNNHD